MLEPHRVHRGPERTCDALVAQLPAERGVQHLDEARSAVGERAQRELVVRRAGRHPSAMASAASGAVSVPPKQSGAIRTRMGEA